MVTHSKLTFFHERESSLNDLENELSLLSHH